MYKSGNRFGVNRDIKIASSSAVSNDAGNNTQGGIAAARQARRPFSNPSGVGAFARHPSRWVALIKRFRMRFYIRNHKKLDFDID